MLGKYSQKSYSQSPSLQSRCILEFLGGRGSLLLFNLYFSFQLSSRATVLFLSRSDPWSNMLPTILALFIAFLATTAPISGLPIVTGRGYDTLLLEQPAQPKSLAEAVRSFPEINVLLEGNQRFRDSIANSSNPNLLKEQTDAGQSPGFLFLGCRCVPFAVSLSCTY